jgi:hypothetical protein
MGVEKGWRRERLVESDMGIQGPTIEEEDEEEEEGVQGGSPCLW